MSLYHRDVYIPKSIHIPEFKFSPIYTEHALDAAEQDRYGKIRLPLILDLHSSEVIELETDQRESIIKAVYRQPYNNTYDLVLVFSVPSWRVKTVWLNNKNDTHTGLDYTSYEKP